MWFDDPEFPYYKVGNPAEPLGGPTEPLEIPLLKPSSQRPSTPTGLHASVISSTEIDLAWNAVANVTYTLQRSTDNSHWSTIYTGSTAGFADTGRIASTKYYYHVLASNVHGASAYSASINATTSSTTFAYTPFIVGNTGQTLATHMASNIGPNQRLYRGDIAVAPNGTVISVCNYDEGSSTVPLIVNGAVVARFIQINSQCAGTCSAVNNTIGFAPAMLTPNSAYPGQYPDAGKVWFGVACFSSTNGNAYNFPGGKGFTGVLGTGWFLKLSEMDSPQNPITNNPVISMACSATNLYIYVAGTLYIATDMANIATSLTSVSLALTNAGPMALDPNTGNIWIVQDVATVRTAVEYDGTGTATARAWPVPSNTTGLAVDATRGILSAADGTNNVIADITISSGSTTTFGSSLPSHNGAWAGGRFLGLLGIGYDAAGNRYTGEDRSLLDSFVTGYTGNGTTVAWTASSCGSETVWGVDPADDSQVYDAWHRYTFGYDGTWSIAGITVDPVLFPNDPRIQAVGDFQAAIVFEISGSKFQQCDDLILRKDPTGGSETFISCAQWIENNLDTIPGAPSPYPPNRLSSGSQLWQNTAGDGQYNAGEFTAYTSGDTCWAPFVDSAGTMWRAYDRGFITKWTCSGLDGHGVPIYSAPISEGTAASPSPQAPFTRYQRFVYNPSTDVAVVMGYTAALPQTLAMQWGMAGTVLAVYDHWTGAGSTVRSLRYTVTLPTAPSSFYTDMVRSIWVAAATIYCEMWQSRYIHAYRLSDGLLLGTTVPSTNAAPYPWQDLQNGLHGVSRGDGTDWLFAPNSTNACVMAYQVTP